MHRLSRRMVVVRLVVAGWKLSLVDVWGRVSFTVWLCGCNLRCPFCHNWRIAEGASPPCRRVGVGEVLEAAGAASRLADYLHVTGGEPLLQARALRVLLRRSPLPVSLDSNLTMPGRLRLLEGCVDHVATDLKAPWGLLTGGAPAGLWRAWLESLRVAASWGAVVELRIPVPRGVPGYLEAVAEALDQAAAALDATDWYVVVNPLQGPPYTDPRDREWCSRHCDPPDTLLERVAEEARRHGVRVYVRRGGGRRADNKTVLEGRTTGASLYG